MSETEVEAGRRRSRANLRPIGRLAPLLRAHWRLAAGSASFLVLSSGATLALSGAARLVIDRGFARPGALNATFAILAAVAAALAIATALRFYFTARLGEQVVADLRVAVLRHVLGLDPTTIARLKAGEIAARMSADVAVVEAVIGTTASVALRNLLTLIGALILLAIVGPGLMLYVFLLGPAVIAPLVWLGRGVRRRSAGAQARLASALALGGESVGALETVQAFGRERAMGDRFEAAVRAAFAASLARVRARAVMTALVIGLVFAGVAAIFWLGAQSVAAGRMSGGALLQFAILAVLAAGAVGSLGEAWGEVQKAGGAMDRIGEVLDAKPLIQAPPSIRPLPHPSRGAIIFEGVRFAYPSRMDTPALDGFDLAVRPGERVALVGPSGAGKSTVFRLLLRFHDPDAGSVRLDGVDLREADPAQVRARLALVNQEASLLSGSALDNILLGREGADAAAAEAAAQAAQIASFLAALPGGMAADLGERGGALSGGQRQRLAIARALVRDAPILLLDEATSALDAENERLVQEALHAAMRGRTTLVIAHRLATVLEADRIVVMDAGRVAETGTHAELFAQGGLYARLARLQFRARAA